MTWPLSCVRANESLAKHTSFRIGGPAEWFAEPLTVEELAAVLQEASARRLSITVLGGGTNSLASDRGVRGLVLHLGRGFQRIERLPASEDGTVRVRCGAALTTQRLVSLAAQEGWGGLDVLAGLPGQIGGAVSMNAQGIGAFVDSVTLATFDGSVRQVGREELLFKYRDASLPAGIVTDVVLHFPTAPPDEASASIQKVLERRNCTQEVRLPSAGCAFRNPPGEHAGRLIDQAGLKGSRIGDALVSPQHANFIVNLGSATCDDVLSLMEHIQRRVLERFGVRLEPELRVMGQARKAT